MRNLIQKNETNALLFVSKYRIPNFNMKEFNFKFGETRNVFLILNVVPQQIWIKVEVELLLYVEKSSFTYTLYFIILH